ncbi:MAG: hypothetical protein ACPG4K_09340 [Haloferula sp.]
MKISSLPSWALPAGGVGLALIAGILIGRNTVEVPDHASGTANDGRPERDRPTVRPLRNEAAPARDRGQVTVDTDGMNSIQELDNILGSTSRLTRTQRLLAYLDRLPTEQFAEAYLAIASSPLSDVRRAEHSLVLQAWAERDPLGALGHLQENEAEDWERETAVSTWATIDPDAAFAWASSAEDEGTVNNWITGALRGMAAVNPDLARDYLTEMEPGDTRSHGLRGLGRYVTQYGFDYATKWINGIEDESLQSQASRSFADELVALDPAQAGEWNASIADTKTRRDVSETVADRWARQDLVAAKEWVNGLPADTQSEAAEGVARHYARQNPTEAADWLAGLGENPDLDGARRIFIEESFRQDPQTSLGFVANLSNEKLRTGLYHRYLGSWMRSDREAAREWASANSESLPSSVTKRLLR